MDGVVVQFDLGVFSIDAVKKAAYKRRFKHEVQHGLRTA